MARHGKRLAFRGLAAGWIACAAVAQAAPADESALVSAGRELALHGASGVPACFTCHGPKGLGDGGHFPRIAGKPAQFIADRVHAFQARARNSAPAPGTMTDVSTKLDERQIKEAAAYLSQFDAEAEAP